ncbi:MAG: hypothetical protein ACPGJV_10460 [Bacteriovoracaceae bacterium]
MIHITKMLLMTFLLIGSSHTIADEIDDLFAGGESEREFEFKRFSREHIFAAIAHDAKLVCKNGLCTLTASHKKYRRFNVSFSLGEGNQNDSISTGGGTIIDLGGNNNNSDDSFWGLRVSYEQGYCDEEIRVPRLLYYVINRYIAGLLDEEGDTRMGFTPADEAMIMFYTTISKQLTGCDND